MCKYCRNKIHQTYRGLQARCHHTMMRYLRSSTVSRVALPLDSSLPKADWTICLLLLRAKIGSSTVSLIVRRV
uniref:Uncharacterized protein n=1 Tax=Arundo donax TaxID=35708 RepID=A0A0A9E5K9_ARUDO